MFVASCTPCIFDAMLPAHARITKHVSECESQQILIWRHCWKCTHCQPIAIKSFSCVRACAGTMYVSIAAFRTGAGFRVRPCANVRACANVLCLVRDQSAIKRGANHNAPAVSAREEERTVAGEAWGGRTCDDCKATSVSQLSVLALFVRVRVIS